MSAAPAGGGQSPSLLLAQTRAEQASDLRGVSQMGRRLPSQLDTPAASHLQPLPGAPLLPAGPAAPLLAPVPAQTPARCCSGSPKPKSPGMEPSRWAGASWPGCHRGRVAAWTTTAERRACGQKRQKRRRAEEAAAEVTHGALAGETRGSGASQTPDRHTGCRKGAALGPLQNPLPARGRQPAGWSAGRR